MIEILRSELIMLCRAFLLFLKVASSVVGYWYDGNCVIRHEFKRWAEFSLSKTSGNEVFRCLSTVTYVSYTSNYQNKGGWIVFHIKIKMVCDFQSFPC